MYLHRFRWADLQLQSLASCLSPREIKSTLNSLPKDLDSTYDRILSAISNSEENATCAIRLLHFIAFSLRPMTVEELAETLAVDIESNDGPYVIHERKLFQPNDILFILSALVTTRVEELENWCGKTRTFITFAHFSVQEYLVSDRIQGKPHGVSIYSLTPRTSHKVISRICLSYLLQFSSTDCFHSKPLTDFPLASYAAKFWTQHVCYDRNTILDSDESVLKSASKLMQMQGCELYNWFRIQHFSLLIDK